MAISEQLVDKLRKLGETKTMKEASEKLDVPLHRIQYAAKVHQIDFKSGMHKRHAKITESKVKQIWKLREAGLMIKQIAYELKTTYYIVWSVLSGKSWVGA